MSRCIPPKPRILHKDLTRDYGVSVLNMALPCLILAAAHFKGRVPVDRRSMPRFVRLQSFGSGSILKL